MDEGSEEFDEGNDGAVQEAGMNTTAEPAPTEQEIHEALRYADMGEAHPEYMIVLARAYRAEFARRETQAEDYAHQHAAELEALRARVKELERNWKGRRNHDDQKVRRRPKSYRWDGV